MYFVLFWGLFPPPLCFLLSMCAFLSHISLSNANPRFFFPSPHITHYSLQICEVTFTPKLWYTLYLTPSCVKTNALVL